MSGQEPSNHRNRLRSDPYTHRNGGKSVCNRAGHTHGRIGLLPNLPPALRYALRRDADRITERIVASMSRSPSFSIVSVAYGRRPPLTSAESSSVNSNCLSALWWLDEGLALKATVEIRAGCRSLNVNRLSSGRLRGGYHVRGPVVENMIAVATY